MQPSETEGFRQAESKVKLRSTDSRGRLSPHESAISACVLRVALAQQEDHLFGRVVEGSLGEGAIFPNRLQSCQKEQRAQVRVGVVAEPKGFRLFKNQCISVVGAEDEGEAENLMDLVDRIFAKETVHDLRRIGIQTPLHLGDLFTNC